MGFVQLSDHSYLLEELGVGIVKSGKDALIIDTGFGDEDGQAILSVLKEQGLSPAAVYNTHAHIDHFGGNAYIKEACNTAVYAPSYEASVIACPELHGQMLFGGAVPPKAIKERYSALRPCTVDVIVENEVPFDFGGLSLTPVHLPGHTPGQTGLAVDDVLFCADSLMSRKTFDKLRIPYFTDIKSHKETLQLLWGSDYGLFVPSHCPPVEDPCLLIGRAEEFIIELECAVLKALEEPLGESEMIERVFALMDMPVTGVIPYHVSGTTVMSALASLISDDKIEPVAQGYSFKWKAIS